MLTAIIVLLYVYVLCMCIAEGEWLGLLISTAVVLFLVGMIHIDHEDAKAYINFRDYWAKGGPRAEKRNIAKEQRELNVKINALNREIDSTLAQWNRERNSKAVSERPRGEEWKRYIERESMLDGKCRRCGSPVNVSEFMAEGAHYLFYKCDACKDVCVIPK